MRNLKIYIAYRGTAYHGFQRQPNAKTIQETVEKAIGTVLNEPVTVHGCSRTDAGVHANRFCLSLKTEKTLPERNLLRGVNGLLPKDISILSAKDAPEDFHARFSALGKEYVYLIHNSESHNPFASDLMYHYRRPTDLELIRRAASKFVGEKDFSAFCAANSSAQSPVRTVYSLDAEKCGDALRFTICGNGFLYNMVRIIIGTVLTVNEGYFSPDDIDEILASRDRTRAGRTAPACGLYLNNVFYNRDDLDKAIKKTK